MVIKKNMREKGKLRLSQYFQNLEEGDSVAFVREVSVHTNVPQRYQGRTGVVSGKRGRAAIVKIKDGNKQKELIVEPIHLKKIKNTQ